MSPRPERAVVRDVVALRERADESEDHALADASIITHDVPPEMAEEAVEKALRRTNGDHGGGRDA